MASCTAEYLRNLLMSDAPFAEPIAPPKDGPAKTETAVAPLRLPHPLPDSQMLLVDESEARRRLGGISAKTLYRLRQQGLPFLRVGTRVMYAPLDLSAWIGRNKISAS